MVFTVLYCIQICVTILFRQHEIKMFRPMTIIIWTLLIIFLYLDVRHTFREAKFKKGAQGTLFDSLYKKKLLPLSHNES